MEETSAKLSRYHFWGTLVPGALFAAFIIFLAKSFGLEHTLYFPSQDGIRLVLFLATSYLLGLCLYLPAQWMERHFFWGRKTNYPFLAQLDGNKGKYLREHFQKYSLRRYGLSILNDNQVDLIPINVARFFSFCTYQLDQEKLYDAPMARQSQYFFFRNISLFFIGIAIFLLCTACAKVLGFAGAISGPVSKLPGWACVVIAALLLGVFLGCIYATRRQRKAYTREVYSIIYYLSMRDVQPSPAN